MAGAQQSEKEVVREVSLYVPQDAVDAALITQYGTPLPDLTMEQVQNCLLNTELNGEFVSASNSDLPPMEDTAYIGKLSGSMEIFTGGTAQEIFHFTHFSGAFSGALEVDTPGNDEAYCNAIFNSQQYQFSKGVDTPYLTSHFGNGDSGGIGFKGHFKYVKSGANYMSASIGAPKQISGSFPSNYQTSSAVTTQDLNDISQSNFTGSFTLTSGSIVSADFHTRKSNGTALSSFDGAYDSVNMKVEAAFGLGDMSGATVSRHFMIGGQFTNSSSLNNTNQADNVGLVLNIVAGKVFTTSGSISHSLESLSDGAFIDRSPGTSNSGNYHAKCQGVDSNGKAKKKKSIVGAKNRVELKTKRDNDALRVGTPTGRAVLNR
tara:strand:- start:644 stop:1771 length:1128 start_codon:yes stop_codon:yes gene_type:complete